MSSSKTTRQEAAQLAGIQEFDVYTDSREILANATNQVRRNGYDDWLICDIDTHHVEAVSWGEIVKYIRDPVLRDQAVRYHHDRFGGVPYGLSGDFGLRYQDVGGRISHQSDRREPVEDDSVHRDVALTRRAMDGLCVDYMAVFPNSMLMLGMHPQRHMEVVLAQAYNRWLVDTILDADSRIVAMVYLPLNDADAACQTVEEFRDHPGVVGFCVASTRYQPVHANEYMRLYRMIEECGKPVAFHAAYHWQDPSLATIPTFLGMHALGFMWCNMVHMTNWILSGIPVRFPNLKSIWIESGLAWIPALMQRLDDQYLMRQSEAPLLTRMPSEYMREHCWYSSQPMERSNMKALEVTLEMINAPTQLLYASDWPHFDFDTPGTIHDLPFLSETAKRNILGLNAARLFGLPETKRVRATAQAG